MTTATVTATACCAPLGAASLSDAEAEATARLFKALADPHRVKIVNLLATSPDPVCVCEFTAPLSLSQPTVSHHLKKLVDAGLLGRGAHLWPPWRSATAARRPRASWLSA